MPILVGTRLGRHEIVAPLGTCGMGEVYRAHGSRLGRDITLQLPTAGAAGYPNRLARQRRAPGARACGTRTEVQ